MKPWFFPSKKNETVFVFPEYIFSEFLNPRRKKNIGSNREKKCKYIFLEMVEENMSQISPLIFHQKPTMFLPKPNHVFV
jgi:hypothetical protein